MRSMMRERGERQHKLTMLPIWEEIVNRDLEFCHARQPSMCYAYQRVGGGVRSAFRFEDFSLMVIGANCRAISFRLSPRFSISWSPDLHRDRGQ
jgi:hypothetical protein